MILTRAGSMAPSSPIGMGGKEGVRKDGKRIFK